MLEELAIDNLGPLTSARLTPARGMTAITGETGAGKSMLLSALQLLSGAPSDHERVHPGAQEAKAQAIFDVSGNAQLARVAAAAGIDLQADDNELFLARIIPRAGRARAIVSGKTMPKRMLEQLAPYLFVIHGQSDQLRAVAPSHQRELLDALGEFGEALPNYQKAYASLQALDAQIEELTSQLSQARAQSDYLRESIERIDRVQPQAGEYEDLLQRRERKEHAADIHKALVMALGVLDPSQVDAVDAELDAVGVLDGLQQASQALSAAGRALSSQFVERLNSAHADIADVVYSLSDELSHLDVEDDLDALNTRIHELNELMRRWGPTLDEVIAWREHASFDLEDLATSPEKLESLRESRAVAAQQALVLAQQLHEARERAASVLSAMVNEELQHLSMPGARLTVRVTARQASVSSERGENGSENSREDAFDAATCLDSHGYDDVAFLFQSYPDAPLLPLGKSASGGELSRLMLAIELSIASRARQGVQGESAFGLTFIFDEVDAGVGGKAGAELGRRLALLAQHNQVIVVTHLPQVASYADAQYVVAKRLDAAGGAQTSIHLAQGEERVIELARMLSGSESAASLEHARELLAQSTI